MLVKTLDTLRTLSASSPVSSSNNGAPSRAGDLDRHLVMDDGRSYEAYLRDGWEWNKAKFRVDNRKLEEVVETLVKDLQSTDNVHKAKLGAYNQAKGQLQQMMRKKTCVAIFVPAAPRG